jgi:hypothetical protein
VDSQQAVRTVRILLCFGGLLTGSAFLTVALPTEWMASTHERLGFGQFPEGPLVQYLARSVSAFYGFHGVLLFVVASDPVRFKPIVIYLAAFNIIFGLMLIAIDLHAGMPTWWTISEGPSIIVIGLLLAMIGRRV